MIHNMKHGGNIALLGLRRTDAKVDLETVIFNGLNIRGIYGRKVSPQGSKVIMEDGRFRSKINRRRRSRR